ncbi:MAG: XdhC family protein [Spirochaetota bacterium]|jgi:xanthine dehydrogenase accessory factor|nr:XdhC family protein [Spirochaetota bacterium]
MNNINSGEVFESLVAMRSQGRPVVLVTVISKEGHGPAAPGAKMVVGADGRIAGTIGGGNLEYLAVKKAQELLAAAHPEPLYEVYDVGANDEVCSTLAAPTGGKGTGAHSDVCDETCAKRPRAERAQATGMICGGRASLFFERYGGGENMVVFGAGHIGCALARALPGLGYGLTVIDSRKEYIEGFPGAARSICHDYGQSFEGLAIPPNPWVVIATHTHTLDYAVLEQVYKARWNPRYIGLVASRKKRALFLSRLREAVPDADTSMLYMPAGLDIGGTGPDEIVISILSEIQSLRFNRTILRHMRD